eukprot:scaffold20539_cov81-Skeletonema_marinoi.AAC.1
MAPTSTTLLNSNPASVAFSSATLTTNNIQQQKPTKDKQTTAYYRDSSGRACVQVRAQLDFSDGGGADALLVCGCIEPAPVESEAVKKALAALSDNNNNEGGEPAQSGSDEE